jgi:N-[(2S)-2-amino-2-carboxyethyl]-L-glutamate dehydrogenase
VTAMLPFHVIGGPQVRAVLSGSHREVVEIVKRAYLLHHAGLSVNPRSYFLRFDDRPRDRIIALPAHLGGDVEITGIKWVASFPENISQDLPRASAVLILNDPSTGYPTACLEASQINACRTAASAVFAAEELGGRRAGVTIAVVGAGIIARNVVEFFHALGWPVRRITVHDRVEPYAEALACHARGLGYDTVVAPSLEQAVAEAGVVVLATTAPKPHITDQKLFSPGQVVLNLSLRDIAEEVVLASYNVVDDVDHCLTADTSPHLAEQLVGHRRFIDGTLAQVMLREIELGEDKPTIFSPFGLGVLDLAVGAFVRDRALEQDAALEIGDFFAETSRWGAP